MNDEDDRDAPHVGVSELTRRGFLKAGAAGAVTAALAGCNEAPQEHIVPYVDRPAELTPGISRYYATAALRSGVAIGVLGESRDGRPIKIEGNPQHPFSRGATGPIEQALPLTLYDGDRIASPSRRGAPASHEQLWRELGPGASRAYTRNRGQGLHLWLSPSTSPLLAHLLERLEERHPNARVWFDATAVPATAWEGSRRVFDRVLVPQYDFSRADRVLALDSSFLVDEPGSVRWARDWAERRAPEGARGMSRCYAVEPAPTGTGAAFDHRLTVSAGEVARVAAGLLAALRDGAPEDARARLEGRAQSAPHPAWIRAVADDLAQHRGRAIVIAGEQQPSFVHVLAHLLNAALDSYGNTIRLTRAPWLRAGEEAFEPEPLMDALDAGEVDALFCLGGDPAYSARGWLDWAEHARRASELVVLAQFPTETARMGGWVIPELHLLERWGDALAWDGTRTPIQPLIRPLHAATCVEEILLRLIGDDSTTVRRALADLLERDGHELASVLERGLVPSSELPSEPARASWSALGPALDELDRAGEAREGPFELTLRRSLVEDAAHAHNGWLQELPELFTRVAWDNAVQMAAEDARRLALEQGDVVEVATPHGSVRLPVVPVHGQEPGTLVALLGYGRSAGGSVARRVGVDVDHLRVTPATWILPGVRVRRTGAHHDLATFHPHHDLPGEHDAAIVFRTSLARLRREPDFVRQYDEPPPTLYPERLQGSPQWGMAIDMNRCVGCQACVVACQAENNIPVVGKAQVELGRAMHWLRIDAYYRHGRPHRGEHEEVRWSLQPMLCQHCEKAPCEYVCPVNATVHSPDGLNEMVYNRCVGTRFCSNNCPYKIRRFNWFDFHRTAHEPETMVFNPDVTVRGRGVMEKCTYCVQRIRRAQIQARTAERPLADGDVVTACQQACPTGAFVFGDVSDGDSRVSRWYARHRTYAVLHDLGTRPRTRYLARVDNENEEITGG